jgi:oligopeptide transport system substrate-binding protein
MKRKATFVRLFCLAACLLLACQLSETATPGAAPTLAPAPTSLSPTAAATIVPNAFTSAGHGVSLRYPSGWTVGAGDSEQNLAVFFSADSSVQSALYAFMLETDLTLAEAAQELNDAVLTGLEDLQIINDGEVTLDDGLPAWSTLVTAATGSGEVLKIHLLTALYGGREYLLLTFGQSDAYDYYADDVWELALSMHLELPSLYDIPREQALVLSGGESTNPREYDPATTHSGEGKRVFSGLVSFDTELNLVPELAESWDVSPDGTVYTFHLRPNARFHDGRPVTAGDFIYSWERAADPATASDTVLTYLGDILGVREMYNGEADHISGLRAVDEHTLEVTIDAPIPYFLMKLTYPTAFVVDQANVESGPEWYRTPNGTGPYRLIRWERFEVMIYERNLDYYLGVPPLPYIVVELYSGIGIRLYEAGEIDIAGVSTYDVDRILDPEQPLHDQVRSGVSLCTDFVVFDVTQPPFDDRNVRQAFVMAVDRQQYIDVLMNGIGLPAEGLYPPALPGYNLDLGGLPYDPETARQLLAQSPYRGPAGLPPIVFTSGGIGNDASSGVAALVQMWEQNLGVRIIVENLEPNMYYDLVYGGQHGQIVSSGWCADYPDPENFADALFRSGAQQNLGNYSNPELDALLDQARIEPDVARRIELYQQAEQIIVQDAPAVFLVHDISYVLVKPYVHGYVLTPIDIPLERYLWVER